jgi:drug/metabolite transporter (DMT)-like permease
MVVRMIISVIIACVLAFVMRINPLKIDVKAAFFFLFYGLIYASLAGSYITALAFGTPVAIAILLNYTQPVFSALFGRFLLKEKIGKFKVLLIIIAIVGVAVILEVWSVEIRWNIGVIFALFSGFLYAAFIYVGTISNKQEYFYLTTLFWTFLFSAIWLFPIYELIISKITQSPRIMSWTSLDIVSLSLLITLALLGTVLPYSLMLYGVKRVPMFQSGVILLSEPLFAILLSFLLLRESLGIEVIVGAALILSSAILINYEQ